MNAVIRIERRYNHSHAVSNPLFMSINNPMFSVVCLRGCCLKTKNVASRMGLGDLHEK